MRYIKVTSETYTDPNMVTPSGPAIPMAYTPNLIEAIKHAVGKHFTFGQPYCVVCLKKEAHFSYK